MSTKRKRDDDGSPDTKAQPVQCTVKVVLPGVRGSSGRPDVLSYTHLGNAPPSLEELKTQVLSDCRKRWNKDFPKLKDVRFFFYTTTETTTETDEYLLTHEQLTEATYQAMLKTPERRNGPGKRFVLELPTVLYMAPMVQGLFNPVTLEEQEQSKAALDRDEKRLERHRCTMINKMSEHKINAWYGNEEEEEEKQQLLHNNLWAPEGPNLAENAVVTAEMIDRMERNLKLYERNRAQFRRNGKSRTDNERMLYNLTSKGVKVTLE